MPGIAVLRGLTKVLYPAECDAVGVVVVRSTTVSRANQVDDVVPIKLPVRVLESCFPGRFLGRFLMSVFHQHRVSGPGRQVRRTKQAQYVPVDPRRARGHVVSKEPVTAPDVVPANRELAHATWQIDKPPPRIIDQLSALILDSQESSLVNGELGLA